MPWSPKKQSTVLNASTRLTTNFIYSVVTNLANTGLIVDLTDFFTKLMDHTTKKVGNRWPNIVKGLCHNFCINKLELKCSEYKVFLFSRHRIYSEILRSVFYNIMSLVAWLMTIMTGTATASYLYLCLIIHGFDHCPLPIRVEKGVDMRMSIFYPSIPVQAVPICLSIKGGGRTLTPPHNTLTQIIESIRVIQIYNSRKTKC
ncbi:hypothetical protein AGLY_015762 [Aphis glycines]|uniref:Uncharacterized protein n=1 Tax=Aphis glycines TaxID=307491 RepID=A0A6G0T0Z3_APHGL|nr:hypothetical protein AGLY_015762 [Aphis glycines]